MKRLQTFKQVVVLGLAAAVTPALATGCKKSETPTSATASASASASAAPLVDLKPPPGADPELFGQLLTIVQKCNVNVHDATSTCPGEEARKLGDDFSSGRRSRTDAIPTFARVLGMDNEKMRSAAAGCLHNGFRNSFGDVKPGAVKPEDAKMLLTAVFTLPKTYIRRALPAAVHASMIAGTKDDLFAQLDGKKDPDIASAGYRYVMTHGRLDAFPKVQELAKSEETRVALASIEAAQNMEKWTEDEQAAICPWMTQFLGDKRPSISARSANALNNCGSKYVDEILSTSEKALKDGEFASSRLSGLRGLCTASRRAQPNAPSDAQCERARSLLEKVVQAPKVDVTTRSSALVAITNQWSDARSLAFVKRLQASKAEGLTEQLKTAVRRLERKDKPGAGPSANPHLPRTAAPAPSAAKAPG